jgi:hypothetical protein
MFLRQSAVISRMQQLCSSLPSLSPCLPPSLPFSVAQLHQESELGVHPQRHLSPRPRLALPPHHRQR